jgi:hypothetical protein
VGNCPITRIEVDRVTFNGKELPSLTHTVDDD